MFTGNEDQEISLTQGHAITTAFRTAYPSAPVKAEYFGRKILEMILAQEECVGIRSYNGIDADGLQSSVIVGVDASGNDIVNGVLGDRSFKSPPYNSATNALNS
jgi:hypothetical protein